MAAFRHSVHGVPNVLEPDPVDRLIEAAKDMLRHEDTKRRLNDWSGMPPEIRVDIEAHQVRERWAIWRERFRYSIIRRGRRS